MDQIEYQIQIIPENQSQYSSNTGLGNHVLLNVTGIHKVPDKI